MQRKIHNWNYRRLDSSIRQWLSFESRYLFYIYECYRWASYKMWRNQRMFYTWYSGKKLLPLCLKCSFVLCTGGYRYKFRYITYTSYIYGEKNQLAVTVMVYTMTQLIEYSWFVDYFHTLNKSQYLLLLAYLSIHVFDVRVEFYLFNR